MRDRPEIVRILEAFSPDLRVQSLLNSFRDSVVFILPLTMPVEVALLEVPFLLYSLLRVPVREGIPVLILSLRS